jgi:aminoglycoside phosphotransferase (APT) family kinase protein
MLLRLNKHKNTGRSKKEIIDFTIKEAETLKVLKKIEFKYETPEFICMVQDESEEPEGFIETIVHGIPLPFYKKSIHEDKIIPYIAEVASAIHELPANQFEHLKSYGNNKEHVELLLDILPQDLYSEFPSTENAKEWIHANLQEKRGSVVLHGDLLPQNLLSDPTDGSKISVVDWEFARIGDPAYDLAIVSRGDKKVLGKEKGLKLLLKFYKEAGGQDISLSDVIMHELILVLNWIWESSVTIKKGEHRGHGPDYYERQMVSILRRAEKIRG